VIGELNFLLFASIDTPMGRIGLDWIVNSVLPLVVKARCIKDCRR
jgi:hypothetical protein